jgi:predicted phage terminase large subunit-like protein
LICKEIDSLLADEYDELIILAPPGSAKSTYTSIALPSYYLGKQPKGHVLTASYSTELAEKWGRRVRNTITTPAFARLFPGTNLAQDSKSAGRWATAEGGEFYGAGVGSGILGFRADLAVIDDPISGFEQAQSITQLAKVHEWYETDFITRLKPGGKVVLICQRLARNDLAGYLIDRNEINPTRRQKILRLPMIAGPDDPLGRKPGERLWPEWYTEGMVADAQRDDYKWRTLYQQEPPADTGSWVSTDEIKFAPTPAISDEYTYYGLTDLALSVGKGDYTVHAIIAHHKTTGYCHTVDLFRQRVDPNVSAARLVALCQVYKPAEWLIDDDNASKVFMQLVATEARSVSVPVPWKPMPMRGQDKETRAAALRGMFKRGLMYFDPSKPWTNIVINELLQFPNALGAGVDDCVDTLSLLGRRLASLQTVTPLIDKPKRPTMQEMTLNQLWEDKPKRSARI